MIARKISLSRAAAITAAALYFSMLSPQPAQAHGGEEILLLAGLAAIVIPVVGGIALLFWSLRTKKDSGTVREERTYAFLGFLAGTLLAFALPKAFYAENDWLEIIFRGLPGVLVFPISFAVAGYRWSKVKAAGKRPGWRSFLYVPAILIFLSTLLILVTVFFGTLHTVCKGPDVTKPLYKQPEKPLICSAFWY